jgi:hypothetical protein
MFYQLFWLTNLKSYFHMDNPNLELRFLLHDVSLPLLATISWVYLYSS